ncbi:MAG: ATP-binding protein [Acidobacteriota bacterium]
MEPPDDGPAVAACLERGREPAPAGLSTGPDLADDTARLLATVQASRTAWLATADALSDAIYVVDRDKTLLRVNKAFADAIGESPRELVGRKCHKAIFGNDGPCTACLARDALDPANPSESVPIEVEGHLPGTILEARAIPMPAERAAMITLHDVTRRKAMARQLLESEKLASFGQLAAGMAHEINNPLASAVANIQVALESLRARARAGIVEDGVVEAIEDTRTSLERVRRIVRELGQYAERHQTTGAVPLGPLLHVNALIARDESARPDVELGLLAGELPTVHADPEKLAIALRSILRNAVEASPRRGRVEIAVSSIESMARIVITDDGPGVPEEHRSRIFDPFFTTKRPGPHVGLGLSLAYSLVRGMGGDIDLRNVAGHGCSFVVSVPLAA